MELALWLLASLNNRFCQFEIIDRYPKPIAQVMGGVGCGNETVDIPDNQSQYPRWKFLDTLRSRRGLT